MFENHKPILICASINGAKKNKSNHPNLPTISEEVIKDSIACYSAGANMISFFLKDLDGELSKDISEYRATIKKIKILSKNNLIIQLAIPTLKCFTIEEKKLFLTKLNPDSVLVSIKDLIDGKNIDKEGFSFLNWLLDYKKIYPQYLISSIEEFQFFIKLIKNKVISEKSYFVLFEMGSNTKDSLNFSDTFLNFMEVLNNSELKDLITWSVAYHGKLETACMITASCLGGHIRLGFEYNIHLANNNLAQNNSSIVKQFCKIVPISRRNIANYEQAKRIALT